MDATKSEITAREFMLKCELLSAQDAHQRELFESRLAALQDKIDTANIVLDAKLLHVNNVREEVLTDRKIMVRLSDLDLRLLPIERELSETRGKASQAMVAWGYVISGVVLVVSVLLHFIK